MNICVVIAAYDEEENIVPLTERLTSSLEHLDLGWKVLYVVEGTDGTAGLVARMAANEPRIECLYNSRPSGLGRAFRRGFAAVGPDVDLIITMDADLNHDPKAIPGLIGEAISTGADIVIGSRRVQHSTTNGMPWIKLATGRIVNLAMRAAWRVNVRDMTSSFRVYRTSTLRNIHFQNDDFAFLPEIIIKASKMGKVIIERPIHFVYRKAGRSKMAIWTTSVAYLRLFRSLLLDAG